MTATTSDSSLRDGASGHPSPAGRALSPCIPRPNSRNWREEPGLRRALWGGQPTWSVSRYQDIRAALVDPRLSADTISGLVQTVRHGQHAGDVCADRRSRAPSVAADDDQSIHLQAYRSDAAADSGDGRPIPRHDDRERAAGRHRARLRLARTVFGDRASAGRAARRPRALPAQHLARTGHQDVRRAKGAGLRDDVRLHTRNW